jgi:hypothetical protein
LVVNFIHSTGSLAKSSQWTRRSRDILRNSHVNQRNRTKVSLWLSFLGNGAHAEIRMKDLAPRSRDILRNSHANQRNRANVFLKKFDVYRKI